MLHPRASAVVLASLLVGAAASQDPAPQPGPRPDGSILLPNGWSLAPHGRQIALDSDLPVRFAPHPGGRFVAVQHAGYREHRVALFDVEREEVVAATPIPKSWSGMAWSPDGARLYVSGGVEDRVHMLLLDEGTPALEPAGTLAVGDPARLDLVAGMCLDGAGRLFVCLQRTHRLVRLGTLGAPDLEVGLPEGSMPFECVASADGGTLYVSLWGRAEVWAVDAESGERRAVIPSGQHPSSLLVAPDGARLFVSNGNENTVTVVDLATHSVSETLCSALYPGAPPGSTPNALALDAGGEHLLVANADNNDLAVLDVEHPGRARSLGFVPVGHYPTAVTVLRDGRVLVANGKGSVGSRANPDGPRPEAGHRHSADDYTGSLFLGSLSLFAFPGPEELPALSATALRCAPLEATADVRGLAERPADSPIPARVGDPSPIRHCVYVIKENRTYDQVFGDVPEGNGDPELCLFPEQVTPNHHAIARRWVLLDNFYVESEVSADGHEWTMAAYASDFVERTWPVTYGGRGSSAQRGGREAQLGYPAEGLWAIATPKAGYLFDRAREAGIDYRSYGEFTANPSGPDEPVRGRIDALRGHVAPRFRGFDMGTTDQERADRFLEELAEFEARGRYPELVVVHLPNDHTSGTSVGHPTPRAYVADNDLALGRILEGLSRSSFWPSMAVFVVQDDAQNGPDHVDAHRTVALVAGPHVRRGAAVHTMYSTCSMLRTMELILGLEPMSQFDAAALPMYDCFTSEPDLSPYAQRPAGWPLDERNLKTAWGAERSATFDLSREDAADDLALNEVVWRSVKGHDSPMPRPRRAAFVRVLDEDD